jgi:hypothetical protein
MTHYFSGGDDGKVKMAAITHPLLLDCLNRSTMFSILWDSTLLRFKPDRLLFSFSDDEYENGMGPECILELHSFLLDRDRAGGCYVNGETYSELALRVWNFLLKPTTP